MPDGQKYRLLAEVVDGGPTFEGASESECIIDLDNFKLLRNSLDQVSMHLHALDRLPTIVCKLCTTMERNLIKHSDSGCPKMFNCCFKCLGMHPRSACQGKYYRLPSGVCWGCWMPLQNFFGFSFHPKDQEFLGVGCSNPAKNVLKFIAILFFHNRELLPHVVCPPANMDDYISWLFAPSGGASVAGQGQLPNILTLLVEALK